MLKQITKFIFIFTFVPFTSLFAQLATLDWKVHNVGKVRQVVTNMGTLNKALTNFPGLINTEFPPNSSEEHLYQGGLWIAAITPEGDTLVSMTQAHFTPNEFYPTTAPNDTVWVVSKGDTVDVPYWPNYVGVSNQDFVCRYSDYNVLNVENHVPLFLDVIQTSYAWSSPPLDEFIVFKYYVMPTRIPLRQIYVGFWMHSEIGTTNAAYNFIDEHTLYFAQQHMAAAEDDAGGDDGAAISPIGYKILYPIENVAKWSFKYYEHETLVSRDNDVYKDMSDGVIMLDRTDPARAHIVFAFGPFELLNPGDTLRVEMAEVLGIGLEGMLKNAEYLNFLKSKDFRVPSPPPKPVLRMTPGNHEVRLDWQPRPPNPNPELYEDPYRGDNDPKPFEGYRLYKSTISVSGPWTLLAEYDVPDDRIGFNTGLQYEFVDTGLLNNVEYFYSVTAFSKPDSASNFPSQESSLSANALRVVPGTAAPETVGKVTVVPNPYRGDIAYYSFNPAWEKPTGSRNRWMEQDRRVQFINLPNPCVIKIYTLAGDMITTIAHSNPAQGYEDWNLTSFVGQAISSGIYLFTVEDDKGDVQVGKFVVIK